MLIEEILRGKGRGVVTIDPSETVLGAVQRLVEHNIGSLVVVEDGGPVGIITERDVLRLSAQGPERLATTAVADVMTRDMITAETGDSVKGIMDVMTEERIRHLPVLAEGELVGIVSIGDLVNACRASAEDENRNLRHYIQGVG